VLEQGVFALGVPEMDDYSLRVGITRKTLPEIGTQQRRCKMPELARNPPRSAGLELFFRALD